MIDRLHYISPQTEQESPLSAIKIALAAGCKWVQLRVKNEPENKVLDYALAASELCKTYGAQLMVNDYPEIALKTGAFGVHLGLQDMPVKQARELLGPKFIIGGTANTFEDVLNRVADGVDYIGLGPYRFTNTKKNLSPVLGLAGYADILKKTKLAGISLPIIAIGGIEIDDVSALRQAGIYGIAVSAALTNSPAPSLFLKNMYHNLNQISHVNNCR